MMKCFKRIMGTLKKSETKAEVTPSKKYELTDETEEYCGHILRRIRALKSFGNVTSGDLGGWIEKEDNLSQQDISWVYNNAMVFGNAKVFFDAQVRDNAKVFDNALARDDVRVFGNAMVFDNAVIQQHATASGDARVYGNANVGGTACLRDTTRVCGDAYVCNGLICRNAEIRKDDDYFFVDNVGYGAVPFASIFRNQDGGITVLSGPFLDTLEDFEKKVKEKFGRNKYAKEYNAIIKLIKIHFEL